MEGSESDKWLWVVLVLVLLLGGLGCGCKGCLETEKVALLQLKPFFYMYQDSFAPEKRYALYNWVDEGEENSDCCKWESVECDATTGRVTSLSLTDSLLTGDVPSTYYYVDTPVRSDHRVSWYLNASLFLPFEDLKTLSLSGNWIAGCLHNHGFDKLARKLNKLEVLDLSFNHFDDSNVLTSLLQFSSLKFLNLSNNNLTRPIHANGKFMKLSSVETLDLQFNGLDDSILVALSELPSLRRLDLSYNQISGTSHINRSGGVFMTLSSVEILDLKSNSFDDNILVALSDFPSLKHLDLSSNEISGSIHINGFKGLSRLSNLETLHLSENLYLDINSLSHLTGDLSSLKTLDLEYCGFKGTLQIQEYSNLINLKELYLNGNEIESFGSFPEDERESSGLINLEVLSLNLNVLNNSILSSLGPFSKSLTHLSIQYFHSILIKGSINIEDARKRGLKNLEGIDLVRVQAANNSFLPQSLGLFPSLKILHFESEPAIDDITVAFEELRNLTSLEELIVEYDSFLPTNFIEYVENLTSLRVFSLFASGNLSIQGPIHLKNLEYLKIDENMGISLENNFLEKIGAMTSLKILSLTGCTLIGPLSAQGICELTNLEELHIGWNGLTGTLPDCFSNLTSLRHLDLSFNQFSGNLSSIMSLTSIESIDLSNNRFQIPSSLKPFFNHSKLKHLNGDNNHIYVETDLHSLAPRFQLNFISLSCCGNIGTLPKFLHHQHELQHLDLSNINLTGEFPSWLLENNTHLEKLSISNNSLSGHLRFPFQSPRKLSVLDISKNFFDGYIPVEIEKYFPGLTFLSISKNSLHGSIPSSIGDMKLLEVLDLSNNKLSGIIPESLTLSSSLLALILSNNRLQGRMFYSNFNLVNMRILELGGNKLTGVIPISLANSTFLSIIDISDNHFSGRIPLWLGNLSSLDVIIMPNNHIEGPIPMKFCELGWKGVLDLSMNNISGTLPSCFGQLSLSDVHLSKNRLSGPIPNSLCHSTSLVALDLSHNQFSGNIPNCLGNLSELSHLVLKHNNLEGEIPNQFCQLEKLVLIDLSQNILSGGIPYCLNFTAYMEKSIYDISDELLEGAVSDMPGTISFSTDYGSIEFTTKGISYSYKGRNLRFLSGIDLSCNKLTGEIPHQMGNFYMIHVLNLSHNSLRGPIPPSLSNLTQIESLDLSYNNLSGGIPLQFVQLNFLAYFNVSYNNLSGKPPPRAGQFASNIDENSYWGNPFFCGECLLPNKSSTMRPSSNSTQHHEEDVGGLIEVESFWMTFGVSYIIVVLGIAAVLYINPYWRGAWFYFVERVITTCFYFVIDNFLPRRFRFCYI